MSKKGILYLLALLIIFALFKWCGTGGSSVSSLYGTYYGTDRYGNQIEICLRPDSIDEWTKVGVQYGPNLVFKDSKGKTKSVESQTIEWSWDLKGKYVQTYYHGNKRYVIDLKSHNIYPSWGDYLDKTEGIPYKKRQ